LIEEQRVEFDRLWPLLEQAVRRYGETHDKQHVWRRVESGDAQFWALPNSALVTEIVTYETGLREIRGWLAAGDIDEIASFVPLLEDWGRLAGCKRATITGRRGWLRAFNGYRDVCTTMVKEL
jgi:hypothetical protein